MTRSELRAVVVARDAWCVIALLDRSHRCAGRFGEPHDPGDVARLTLGHVREHPGGMRRDEPGWAIAQCHASNVAHDESRLAPEVRAYLLGVRAAGAAA